MRLSLRTLLSIALAALVGLSSAAVAEAVQPPAPSSGPTVTAEPAAVVSAPTPTPAPTSATTDPAASTQPMPGTEPTAAASATAPTPIPMPMPTPRQEQPAGRLSPATSSASVTLTTAELCAARPYLRMTEGAVTVDLKTLDLDYGPLSAVNIAAGDPLLAAQCLSQLRSVRFVDPPSWLTTMTIGAAAFRQQTDTSSLEAISFPEGLTSLTIQSFGFAQINKSDNALAELSFPSTLTSLFIDEYAFFQEATSGSNALSTVSFPAGLRSLRLGAGAFWQRAADRTSLTSISFPQAPTQFELGEQAFEQDSGAQDTTLTSVTFPSNLRTLAVPEGAFQQVSQGGRTTLASINFPDGLTELTIAAQAFAQTSGATTAQDHPATALASLRFPESLDELTVGPSAFQQWAGASATSLTTVSFPDQLTGLSIESSAFYQEAAHSSLRTIHFPSAVTGAMSVGSRAFGQTAEPAGGTTLREVLFPASVGSLTIHPDAFAQSCEGGGAGLTRVVLPVTAGSLRLRTGAFSPSTSSTTTLSIYFPFATTPAAAEIPAEIGNPGHTKWYWFGPDGTDTASWRRLHDAAADRVGPLDQSGNISRTLTGYREVVLVGQESTSRYVYPNGTTRSEPYRTQAEIFTDLGTWTAQLPGLSGEGFLGWCTLQVVGADACAGTLLSAATGFEVANPRVTLWAAWAPPAPGFSAHELAAGTVGIAYLQPIPVTGVGPLSCALGSGSRLPAGLSLDDCRLTGTPSQAGTFRFSVAVTNAGGTTTEELSVVVDPAAEPTVDPDESLALTGTDGLGPLTGVALLAIAAGLLLRRRR